MKEIALIKEKMPEISEMGFVPSKRKGNTGVGYTLECLFEIEENNDSGADLNGKIEFKANRKGRSCRTSGFTQAPIWHYEIRDIIKKYGKNADDNPDRINWYPSLSSDENPAGLKLVVSNDTLLIKDSPNDLLLGEVPLEVLRYRFRRKLDKLFLVYADTKKINKVEHFHYNEAYLCQDIDVNCLKKLIEQDKIVVEPRCHLFRSTGKIRDRGVAYRIKGEYLKDLYKTVDKIV